MRSIRRWWRSFRAVLRYWKLVHYGACRYATGHVGGSFVMAILGVAVAFAAHKPWSWLFGAESSWDQIKSTALSVLSGLIVALTLYLMGFFSEPLRMRNRRKARAASQVLAIEGRAAESAFMATAELLKRDGEIKSLVAAEDAKLTELRRFIEEIGALNPRGDASAFVTGWDACETKGNGGELERLCGGESSRAFRSAMHLAISSVPYELGNGYQRNQKAFPILLSAMQAHLLEQEAKSRIGQRSTAPRHP